MANNPNLALWNAVRAVPKDAQKNFNNGSFSGTDINPTWRQEQLTAHFGLCGIGWYYEITDIHKEPVGNEIITYCHINLYIKDSATGEWSKPIVGVGGNRQVQSFKTSTKVSDEDEKMALTDALSVACKALGIGADVYYASERTKYTANESVQQSEQKPVQSVQQSEQPTTQAPTLQDALNEVASVKSTEELNAAWARWKNLFGKEVALIKAIKDSPFNPKNGRTK